MTTSLLDGVPRADPDVAQPGAPMPWWTWAIAAVVIFAAAAGGVTFVPEGSDVALWWPAAGVCVAFVLLQPASRLPAALALVLLVTALANYVGGYPMGVSIAFGIGNAIEPAVVFAILRYRQSDPRLQSLQAGLRFSWAVALGAIAAGAVASVNVQLLQGGDPGAAFIVVFASNAAAVALIAPFALLPPRIPTQARGAEMAAQAALLLLVTAFAFAPGSTLPLAFLPFPYLAWAALRFPIRVVLVESLALSLLVLGLTLAGGGPFSAPEVPDAARTGIVQWFLITTAAFAFILSTAQYELRAVSRRLRASSRLLSGSVVDAGIGLVIAQQHAAQTLAVWTNQAARDLLGRELGADARWSGPLREAAWRALHGSEQVTVAVDGRTITVAANDIEGEAHRFAVQMVDVTGAMRAQQAEVDAEAAQESARRIRAELERQRDDFLATTSHELRTPITSILGYAELLSESPELTEQHRAWFATIERNAERLSELVEDLLTLSRGATAPLRARSRERIECAELLADVAASLHPMAERRRLDIVVEPRDHVVLGSRSDAARAVSNLLMNAIKFTPVGGRIRLSAHAVGDSVRICVADTGPGMSEEELSHAFVRFYRAPGAERDNVPGAGLGLPIVAELARRNGGAVELARNDDGGLTAELQLPAAHDESTTGA